MKRIRLLLLLLLYTPVAAHGTAPCRVKVPASAARGEDVAANTATLQSAIDRAAACKGEVEVQGGTFRTGSLFVKSNVTLRLDANAVLLGSQDIRDYPERPTRVAGIEMVWPSALINVYQQKNVVIEGEGTIDGDGKVFWDSYWALRKIQEPKGLRWASDYDAKRPRLLQVFDSSNVHIGGGLQLHRSGFWTVHICYSHDVTVDGIVIRNNIGGHGPSTDGVDIDSSRDIVVAHADIDVNDDALCLKAGRDADGLRVNRPTENVVIRDSIIRSGAAAVTFGSETSGGFHHIEAYNLTAGKGVNAGVLFKSAAVRGGGGSDIDVHDLHLGDVPSPILVNLNWNPSYSYATMPAGVTQAPPYYATLTTRVPEAQGLPHFSRIHLWNIDATNARTALQISAYPQAKLNGIHLNNIHITAHSAGFIRNATDVQLDQIQLTVPTGDRIQTSDVDNLRGLDDVHYAALPAEQKSAPDLSTQYDR